MNILLRFVCFVLHILLHYDEKCFSAQTISGTASSDTIDLGNVYCISPLRDKSVMDLNQ